MNHVTYAPYFLGYLRMSHVTHTSELHHVALAFYMNESLHLHREFSVIYE